MTYILISLILITFSYLIYKAYKNTKDIQINKVKVETGDPLTHTSSLSILHLSDLHLENISITPTELAVKLKQESPDLIALTGDFLDRKRTIPKLAPYLKVLQEIAPKHGMYAVLGNHDYVLKDEDLIKLKDLLHQYDCHVLQNSSETISVNGQWVNIIGIDDYSTNRSDPTLAFDQVKEGTNLILTHDPTIVLDMKDYTFDYLLAGHFHGGQICYPKAYHLVKMGKLAQENIIKGLHMHNNSPFYISEGLGQTGVNIRIGSRPEITLHDMAIK
ncbi:putative MPP superfamily phosphohydrolase [Virgibacillus natechei]|uniref:MPP superfamily phosphohydrolase n=1 Tax=Virgibacillus natechei TaxID=1216297 RepID=A0ABS4IG18_9BACI|nr:metallophosphoesterase [Virgibacillus natechei]MBP1969401.1 putative MPP superfamily phosphohydrolase [Virgibacillus natechei]UZD11885.1 metallophosphoesterase [Virgibacillus natechei]